MDGSRDVCPVPIPLRELPTGMYVRNWNDVCTSSQSISSVLVPRSRSPKLAWCGFRSGSTARYGVLMKKAKLPTAVSLYRLSSSDWTRRSICCGPRPPVRPPPLDLLRAAAAEDAGLGPEVLGPLRLGEVAAGVPPQPHVALRADGVLEEGGVGRVVPGPFVARVGAAQAVHEPAA